MTSQPLSEPTKDLIWQGLVEASRLSRYYAALADRHMRRQKYIRGALLAAAIAGFSGLFESVPEAIALVGNVAVVVLVTLDFMHDYGPKAATLNSTSIVCAKVEDEWHRLWVDAYGDQIAEGEAREANRRLENLVLEAAAAPSFLGVTLDEKLNQSSYEQGVETLRSRYATEA